MIIKTKNYLFGFAGSGKTTCIIEALSNVAKDANVAILDADGVSNLPKYKSSLFVEASKICKEKWDFVVIDSLTVLAKNVERKICKEQNLTSIDELPFGKGSKMVADKVLTFLYSLDTQHLITVGHCKFDYQETDGKTHKIKSIIGNKGIFDVIQTEFDTVAYFKNKNVHFSKTYFKYNKNRVFENETVSITDYIKVLLSI